jgi:hypothetical protein
MMRRSRHGKGAAVTKVPLGSFDLDQILLAEVGQGGLARRGREREH